MKIINIIMILLLTVLVSGCQSGNEDIVECKEAVKDAYGYENPKCTTNPMITNFDCCCKDYIKKGRTLMVKNDSLIEFDLIDIE